MTELGAMHTHAARSVLWSGLAHAVSKGAVVVSTMVLARILVPSDFGVFAVGLLVINYLDRFKDVGIGASLVYDRERWERLAGTGLPLSVLTSAVLAGLAFAAAPLAGTFFHDPRGVDLVRALALSLLVSGLAIVPESRLRRRMDFRRRLVPEAAAAVVKGGTSIGLALAGLGVWSLVWGQVGGALVQSVLYWAVGGWRPVVAFDRADAARMLRYGIPSAAVALFAIVIDNLDYLVIGRRMDAEALGYYTLAYRLPELVVIGSCIVIGRVLFPLFSRLKDDRAALRVSYLKAVRYVTVLLVPVALLLALLAEDVVHVAYSSRWDPAVPVLRLLALFTMVHAMNFHAGEVYKAIGRPGILNTIAVVRLAVLLPALWVAAGHSIVAVAATVLVANIGITLLELVVVSRFIALGVQDFTSALRPALLAAVGMTVAVLLGSAATSGLPSLLRLVTLALLGVVTYAAVVRLVAPDIPVRLDRKTRELRGRHVPSHAREPEHVR